MIVVTAASGSAGVGFWQWVGAALASAISAALATIVRWLVRRHDVRRATVTSTVQILARVVFISVLTASLSVALCIIGVDLGPVLGGAGIAGIALAFALRDIAENDISGVHMGLRGPFSPGHQIVTGSHEGTVEELNLRCTPAPPTACGCCCPTLWEVRSAAIIGVVRAMDRHDIVVPFERTVVELERD